MTASDLAKASRLADSLTRGLDDGDAEQEAWIALWKATQTHDPAKGTLWTWAYPRVRGAVLDWLRKSNPRRSAPLDFDLWYIPEDNLANEEFAAHLLTRLTERDRLIVLQVVDGKTRTEVAKALGLSLSRVSVIVKASLEKLEKTREPVPRF